jgi:hypothetical protein
MVCQAGFETGEKQRQHQKPVAQQTQPVFE